MFDGFDRKTLTVQGVDIACVIGGSGPAVLLLHGDSAKPRCSRDASNYSFRAMALDQLGAMRLLGFDKFHLVGHDRGGRTGHRMALDHPQAVQSLAVMDIVPTHTMFMETNRRVAHAYWHWYFLSQPEPFPERLIGSDPDFFYETSLVGWGATKIDDFEPQMLAEYRRCCSSVTQAAVPGGHFFVDRFPDETARIVAEFLAGVS